MRSTGLRTHLRTVGAVIVKNFLEFKRYPVEFFFSFIMPIVWFLPTYFLIRAFAPAGTSEGLAAWVGSNDFLGYFMVGLLVSLVIQTIFWNIGFAVKRLMDIGLLETVWTCPISKTVYIVGESLFSLIRMIYEAAFLLVIYRLLFGMALPAGILPVLPMLIPFLFLMYGFGIGFAALVLLVKEANNIVDTTSFLTQSLTGTQNPPQVLPRFLLVIAMALPITYFLDFLRVTSLGIEPLVPPAISAAVTLVSAVVFPLGGVLVFRLVDRKARTDGTIHVH